MLWVEGRRCSEAPEGYYARGAVATGYTYPVAQSYAPYDANQETADEKTVYYDPVRDVTRSETRENTGGKEISLIQKQSNLVQK